MLNRSLRSRLIMLVGLSVLSLFVISGIAVCLIFEASLWREFDAALRDRTRSLSQLIEQDNNGLIFEWQEGAGVPTPISVDHEVLSVWSSGVLQNVFPPSATAIKPPMPSDKLAFAVTLGETTSARGIELQFEPRIEPEDDEEKNDTDLLQPMNVSLVFARATAHVDATVARLRWTLAIVALLGILATLGLTWLAIGLGLRPIGNATKRIAAIHANTLAQRIEDSECQPRELRPLLLTLNQLLGRLQQTFERERAFSADVAHELRTPLAGLRAKLDLALTRPRTIQEHEQTIRQCLKITEQTGEIVESLLHTTKMEVDATNNTAEPIALRQFVDAIGREFDEGLQTRRLTLLCDVNEDATVVAPRQPLTMIIRNLIDNAVSYADEGSTIRVTEIETATESCLTISNRASEFSTSDIDKVFTRFWRADASRHETGHHSGLGLPLCQRLAHALGGQIQATYRNGKFEVELLCPKSQAS